MRCSRILSMCMVMLSATAQTALASETRVETLRYNGGVEDATLMYTYPGMISKYQLALIELGNKAAVDAYAGAFTDVGFMQVGATVSRTGWLYTNRSVYNISLFDRFETAMLDTANSGPALYGPQRPVELFAGFGLGGGTLGLRLAFADYKNKKQDLVTGIASSTEYKAQQIQTAIGFHTNAVGSLDVAVALDPVSSQKRTEKSASTDTSTSIKGATPLKVNVRWIASETTGGAYASAMLMSRSYKVNSSSAGADRSSKFSDQVVTLEGGYAAMKDANGPKLFAGVSAVQSASKGPTIVSGSGGNAVVSYLSSDESAKVDAGVISGTLSGEADVAGGFGLMAGMSYVLFGELTEKDNTTSKDIKTVQSFPETTDAMLWQLGLYYRVDALRIDASYRREFLYNGPFFVSGTQTDPLLAKISASYSF